MSGGKTQLPKYQRESEAAAVRDRGDKEKEKVSSAAESSQSVASADQGSGDAEGKSGDNEQVKGVEQNVVGVGKKKEDEGEDSNINAAELAAHHMPDLIEGVKPMFAKEGKDVKEKEKLGGGHADSSTTASQASTDTAAASTKSGGVSKAGVKEVRSPPCHYDPVLQRACSLYHCCIFLALVSVP